VIAKPTTPLVFVHVGLSSPTVTNARNTSGGVDADVLVHHVQNTGGGQAVSVGLGITSRDVLSVAEVLNCANTGSAKRGV
jgi:hypothetical protein